MANDSTGAEIKNRLPITGGVKDKTNIATDFPIVLRDLNAKKEHTRSVATNTTKATDKPILIFLLVTIISLIP